MHVSELLDLGLHARLLEEKYIREQVHPRFGYSIFNYTEKAQFDGVWDEVTKACRGLIVGVDGQVLGRPFEKFFNHGQPEAPNLHLETLVEVTDKLDGSLGILYPEFDDTGKVSGYAVATRGSFTSDQALHATQVLKKRYTDLRPISGLTYLFEIVYPQNRIVVDYGKADDLYLLGAVEIETGIIWSVEEVPEKYWPGPRTSHFGRMTFAQALAMEPRANAEGIVVRSVFSNQMVKIKQEDYVSLHKLIFGLNARAIWERLGAGDTIEQICDGLPDEFHSWVKEVGTDLLRKAAHLGNEVSSKHSWICYFLTKETGLTWPFIEDDEFRAYRKAYAAHAVRQGPLTPWLFMTLDGRDPGPEIWKTLRPSADQTPINTSEDTA